MQRTLILPVLSPALQSPSCPRLQASDPHLALLATQPSTRSMWCKCAEPCRPASTAPADNLTRRGSHRSQDSQGAWALQQNAQQRVRRRTIQDPFARICRDTGPDQNPDPDLARVVHAMHAMHARDRWTGRRGRRGGDGAGEPCQKLYFDQPRYAASEHEG